MNSSWIQRISSCSASGVPLRTLAPARANASFAMRAMISAARRCDSSCACVHTAKNRVTRLAEVTTVAPAARTISITPAGTRSTTGTASPGEYSIAAFLPRTRLEISDSSDFHEA